MIHIASPITNKTATKNIIPKRTLNVPPICSNKDTIFLSANGSHIAEAKWYEIVSTDNFIIGIAHIPITTNIPTIPIEFFKSDVEPSTVSTESPNAFPTTGINVDVAAFSPLAVSPSTLLVNVPSRDKILTNIVTTNPNIHVTPDFKNLDSFPICTLSDKLDTILSDVAISVIGNINSVIVLPINTIAKIINGCIKETDVMLPRCRH